MYITSLFLFLSVPYHTRHICHASCCYRRLRENVRFVVLIVMFAGLGSGLCLDDLPTARGDRVRRRSPDTANSRCDGRRIRSQGEYGLDGQRGVVGDGVELGLVLPPLEVPLTSEANVDGEMEKSNAVVT